MESPSVLFKKFSVPTIFLILGVALLYVGFTTNQAQEFKLAAVLILVGSIITFLNSTGMISSLGVKIIGILSLVMTIGLLYFSSKSVGETIKYQEDYAACKELAKRNLSDVRTAQKAYMDNYGEYAKDWETLINFINTDSTKSVIAEGEKPSRRITEEERNFIYKDKRAIDNNMNDFEAYVLAKSKICPDDLKGYKRDTVRVSFIKTTFTENASYTKDRMDKGFGKFNAEDLPYIPFTDKKKKWKMSTDKVKIGDADVATVRVEGFLPYTKIKGDAKKELFFFGKLEVSDLGGSWEAE